MVAAEKTVAHGVVTVRVETAGKIMESRWLIEEVVFDHAVAAVSTTRVQAHLQVLIINLDVME